MASILYWSEKCFVYEQELLKYKLYIFPQLCQANQKMHSHEPAAFTCFKYKE
jgi:hypothetical protein